MKTFEEKWTAWIDGELTGHDLAEFEASLPDLAAAEAEKREAQTLGAFLKEHLPCRAMGNEEFFSHQLREKIASDTAVPTNQSADGGRAWWPLGRLVWVVAIGVLFNVIFGYATALRAAAWPLAGADLRRPGARRRDSVERLGDRKQR